MITSAKIICDSISPVGHRLTTFECVFPRIILAEVNTHRVLSRNSASSRAIPVEKMVARVLEDPYVPTHWGKNQRGMQAERDVGEEEALKASNRWKEARMCGVKYAEELLELGIHKQITNRLLEPFMWHTALITGTEFSNFFNLRDNKDAHPDFRDLAHAMRELYKSHNPRGVAYDDWHLPLVSPAEIFDMQVLTTGDQKTVDAEACKISVGRCARTSYLTHHGERDWKADVDLHDGLLKNGHMSPFEHVARPMTKDELELFRQPKMRWDAEHQCWVWVGAEYVKWVSSIGGGSKSLVRCEPWAPGAKPREGSPGDYTHFLGNFDGWVQYRKLIPHEEDILGARQ